MLSEFEIRERVQAIVRSAEPPARKMRMILRIGRMLKRQVAHFSRVSTKPIDAKSHAQLQRLIRSRLDLHEELRLEAARNASPKKVA